MSRKEDIDLKKCLRAASVSQIEDAANELRNNLIITHCKNHEPSGEYEFIKDLTFIVDHLNAILSDFNRNEGVHPNYAIEKLNVMQVLVQSALIFYEHKAKAFYNLEEDDACL